MLSAPSHSRLVLSQLVEKIHRAQSILLTTHKQADGDGLGAQLALYYTLKKMGKKVRCFCVDSLPSRYEFLNHNQCIEIFEKPHVSIAAMDLCLIFDTNDQRVVQPLFTQIQKTAKDIYFIDHHPLLKEGPQPPTGSWVEPSVASSGELAYLLIKELGVDLDRDIAHALYTSIAFDTQVFKLIRNSSNSHVIAAELLKFDIKPEQIHRHLFANYSPEKLLFLSEVLQNIEYFHHHTLAFLKITEESLTNHHLSYEDSRDIIDMIMSISKVQVAVLVCQRDRHIYKVSLRGQTDCSVLALAEELGGGGHVHAAGALCVDPHEDQLTTIQQQIIDHFGDTLPLARKAQ